MPLRSPFDVLLISTNVMICGTCSSDFRGRRLKVACCSWQARLHPERRVGDVARLKAEADARSSNVVALRLAAVSAAADRADVFLSYDCGPPVRRLAELY